VSCRIRWCTAPHTTPETKGVHIGGVAQFLGLAVHLVLVEQPGDEPDEAYVRLLRPIAERVHTYDITPQTAVDMSEVFAAIDVRDLKAVCQALGRAGVVLGATP
jgi:hypothetical protein